MTKIMNLLSLMFIGLLAACVQAKPVNDESLLWRISGQGLTRPSYLVGTMHIGSMYQPLPKSYIQALDQSQVLIVESDAASFTPEQNQELLKLTLSPQPLSISIGKKRMERLAEILNQQDVLLDIQPDVHVKPWVWWLELSMGLVPGMDWKYGVDNRLIALATEQDKPIHALETLEAMYVIDRSVDNDMVKRMLDMPSESWKESQVNMSNLSQAYYQADAQTVAKLALDRSQIPDVLPEKDQKRWKQLYFDQLLNARNKQWLPKIEHAIQQQPVLIAVGSAHLFGEKGLIALLRQQGYQLEPMPVHFQTALEN